VTKIRSFDELGFGDASSVGVKAANLAALRTLGFRDDLTPDGFAVPFHFYDAFMRHNDFYSMAAAMIATSDFQRDADTREESLAKFRKTIKKGKMPAWMMEALGKVHREFPAGTSIRCRSSTNNEDLPGFSGAGLYDSFTHHPNEGHLSKSIKQVYASLWNFRAFEEREFYRIDHAAAAMGVVMHRNSTGEQANGVAVTDDILYQSGNQAGQRYYVNVQLGEDLVTNPGTESIPEEILLSPRNPRTDRIVRRSNRATDGASLLTAPQLDELRKSLRRIEREFRTLYGRPADAQFAMEVEFKITQEGGLYIKQARPWVY
jgi:phosphoenolpyruvate synthase/pyruvate phosphate dikinase